MLQFNVGDLVAVGGASGEISAIGKDVVWVSGMYHYDSNDFEHWIIAYDRNKFEQLQRNQDQINAEGLETLNEQI